MHEQGRIGRLTLLGLATTAIGLAGGTSQAAISGFGDGSGYTLTGHIGDDNGDFASASAPTVNNGTLTITTVDPNQSHQAWYNTPQDISNFTASFVFKNDPTVQGPVGLADGFTLTFQNDSRGLSASGGQAQDLGYGGSKTPITNSAALQFYLRQGAAGAIEYQTGGAIDFDDATPPDNINLVNGDRIQVDLSYNGTTLSATLTDLDDSNVTPYTTSFLADIPTAVNGTTAYVGFTGGTGAGQTVQTISNFSLVPEPASLSAMAMTGVILLRRRR